MILNSYIAGKVLESNLQYIPELFHDVRLFQFCQIFVPILLVLFQFWVYDRIRDRMIQNEQELQT